jgi:hypothetical protein
MKFTLLPLIIFSLSTSLSAKELTIEAHKEQLREIIFEKTFPAAVFEGAAVINTQTGFKKYPTRLVIGIYEGAPKEHAFRVVLEQIEESVDSYWLIYEYVRNSELLLRIELDSEIKLKDIMEFNFLWHETNRVQIVINDTYHFPYLDMKTKTPFISIRAGEATINYDYRGIRWTDRIPQE